MYISNYIKIGKDIYENDFAHALEFETGSAKYIFLKSFYPDYINCKLYKNRIRHLRERLCACVTI